jgi:hypothetical protein
VCSTKCFSKSKCVPCNLVSVLCFFSRSCSVRACLLPLLLSKQRFVSSPLLSAVRVDLLMSAFLWFVRWLMPWCESIRKKASFQLLFFLLLNNYPGIQLVTNLAVAAAQIMHTPPQLATLLLGTYQCNVNPKRIALFGLYNVTIRLILVCMYDPGVPAGCLLQPSAAHAMNSDQGTRRS